MQKIAVSLALAWALVACAATQDPSVNAPAAKAELRFVDLQGFDRDLASSLAAAPPQVDVAFFDRIAPSALPQRLQHWMAAVEAGGGSVKIVPPPGSVTPKSPLLVISALSTLWSAGNMLKEASAEGPFKNARAFDAQIILKRDESGDSWVEKVVFVQRKKKEE